MPKWKLTEEQRDVLPRDLRDDYHRDPETGDWILQIEEPDGTIVAATDPDGALKRAFEAEKIERDKLRAQLRDVRAALELRQKQLAESEERIAKINADGQATLDAMNAKNAPLLAEADAKLKASRAGYDKSFLDHGLDSVIRDAGGSPELLQGKLEKFCRVEHDPETDEARIVVVDDNGVRRDDPVTGQPISAAHALEELRLFDPRLQAAFRNGNNGGAPTKG